MFVRTRWWLVVWNIVVLALVLAIVGVVVHVVLTHSILKETDRNLLSRSNEVVAELDELAEKDDLDLARQGYRGGLFYVSVARDGTILANPQGVPLDTLPMTARNDSTPWYTTLSIDGEPTRLYTRPLAGFHSGGVFAVAVGHSIAPELRNARTFWLVLLIGGGIGLLLSFAAAWFLADRAIAPIRRAYRRQQEFVADASHELRTPLAALHSSTELLGRHPSEPLKTNADLLEDVQREIGRMERLVADLLILGRSDLEQLDLAIGDVNVTALARETVEQMHPIAQDRGVSLLYRGVQEAIITSADPDRLEQVILILLDNALKYTQRGGNVTLSVHRQRGSVLLEVADTGKGIAPEHLGRIFERFYRADQARSNGYGGTGLGLAIARSLVEAHGGKIAVTSAPGKGTTATVRLEETKQDAQ